MFNLSSAIHENARSQPDKKALVCGEESLSFGALAARVDQVASWLISQGVRQGDRIAISCPNLPCFPVLYYGILRAGAIVVPLNILLSQEEVLYHLDDSGARVYFCFEGDPELPIAERGLDAFDQASACERFVLIENPTRKKTPADRQDLTLFSEILGQSVPPVDMASTAADDTAVILYTSGTTGRPKGAELSHISLFLNAWQFGLLTRSQAKDAHLIVLPLFHTFGQTAQMNTGMLLGNTLVLMPKFDPVRVIETVVAEKVSIFCGVPTMYWALLNCKAERELIDQAARQLRLCAAGGASLPVEILNQFEERFNVPIIEGYGLSETSPIATFNRLDGDRLPGSVGTPLWGVDVKITDPARQELPQGETGEVAIRGHNVMKGYYRRPEATSEAMQDGWFYTGDVGRFDERGNLFLVDRVKDMIIRGGYNVYPRELEEVIQTHPAVSLVSVVGVPDEQYGEDVKAFVILNEGAKLGEADLIAWCRERMAAYKYPRSIEFRDTLPMTATGKILKRKLRLLVQQQLAE